MSLTVGEMFAGIGGFGLGFERAGFQVKWQVEIDDYATRVLEKHWPDVKRYRDVRTVHGAHVAHTESHNGQRNSEEKGQIGERGGILVGHPSRQCDNCLGPVDVICGGFPCQPHSLAGRRAASADERDLWGEFARIIREVRPRWVVAENVPGLLSSESGRFFGRVLRDLAESGYDAEWDCIPASAVGAPHRRDRVWIVAYPNEPGSQGWNGAVLSERAAEWPTGARGASMADTDHKGQSGRAFHDATRHRLSELAFCDKWWRTEPNVGRVAHGIPARVDRLRCLGNAVVPPIPEWIARRILDAEGVTA